MVHRHDLLRPWYPTRCLVNRLSRCPIVTAASQGGSWVVPEKICGRCDTLSFHFHRFCTTLLIPCLTIVLLCTFIVRIHRCLSQFLSIQTHFCHSLSCVREALGDAQFAKSCPQCTLLKTFQINVGQVQQGNFHCATSGSPALLLPG